MTSQERKIAITVEGGAIVSINFGYHLKLDSPCTKLGNPVARDDLGGNAKVTYGFPLRITNGEFSTTEEGAPDLVARILGKFSGDRVGGHMELEASPSSGCSGKDKVTWSATHAAPKK
jgi:hypothetical protein